MLLLWLTLLATGTALFRWAYRKDRVLLGTLGLGCIVASTTCALRAILGAVHTDHLLVIGMGSSICGVACALALVFSDVRPPVCKRPR